MRRLLPLLLALTLIAGVHAQAEEYAPLPDAPVAPPMTDVQAQTETYKLLWSYETGGDVGSISISADGRYVAAGSDNKVYFFDRSGKLLWSYETSGYVWLGSVWLVSISADGRYVAAGSGDGKVYLFDRSGKLLWSYKTGSWVRSVSISADGRYVAAGSEDNKVYLFDRSGELLWSYRTGGVNSVSLSADGEYIAAGSNDYRVYFFDRSGRLLWSYETGGDVDSVSLSADGRYIVAGSWDNKVYLFDRSGKLLWSYETGWKVYSVSISADGEYVAAGLGDGKVYLFDRSGRLLWSYRTGSDVDSVSITPDGRYIAAAGSYDKKVYLFDHSGKLLWSYEIKTGLGLGSISLSADGKYIATGSEGNYDNKIYFFSRESVAETPVSGAEKLSDVVSEEKNPSAFLFITTSPSGASVYIDGSYRGKTPLRLKLSPGEHIVKLSKAGYRERTTRITLSGGESKNLEFELIPVRVITRERTPQKKADRSKLFALLAVLIVIGALLLRKKPSEPEEKLAPPSEAQPKHEPAAQPAQPEAEQREQEKLKFMLSTLMVELKELVAKAEQLGVDAPSINPVESLAEAGEYEKAIQEAKRLKQEITRLIDTSRPEINVELESTRFRLNVGTRTKLHLRNRGKASARNIELKLSEDESLRDAVEFRILSLPEELPPGEAQPAELWFTLTREGDLPLVFHLKYRDALGREYEHKQEVWVTVSSASEAPTPQPAPQPTTPQTPQDFTPKPTTPRTFPAELAEAYAEPEFIGRGGFARVFKAKRKGDGREVAVKLPLTLDPATGKSFIRELQNWTRLKHANIVAIYDYNILPIPYFEMELCDCSLADISKPMDVKEAAYIIFNVADGLRHAHAQGIIHRDLKPQNIMLRQGVPKISDWGLSKVVAESRTSLASFTPYYAAPEQISGGAKDHRIDIWQLGVIFYELVTGELPFKGESLMEIATAITTKQPPPPSQINPEAKEVEHIIMKCLEKQPEKRYQSAAELQRELAMYLGMSVKESLSQSLSVKDFSRSAYYCGELLVVNLKLGDGAGAYKYASDLLEYCKGEVEEEMRALAEQIKVRLEERLEIPQELIEKAEILVHKLKLGFERV